jgi:hypothetical protein
VVLGKTSPCLFLADGLAASFGVWGDMVEPSGSAAVERANGVVAEARLLINLVLGLSLGVALVFVLSGVTESSVIVPTEDSSLEVDDVEDVVPTALLAIMTMVAVSLVVVLAAMVAVFLLLSLSLAAMLSVLMLLALSDVSLTLVVMVLLAIAADAVVGESVRKFTLHRTDNGESASSSSNAANTPCDTNELHLGR